MGSDRLVSIRVIGVIHANSLANHLAAAPPDRGFSAGFLLAMATRVPS
jgi:hypothetical protein